MRYIPIIVVAACKECITSRGESVKSFLQKKVAVEEKRGKHSRNFFPCQNKENTFTFRLSSGPGRRGTMS